MVMNPITIHPGRDARRRPDHHEAPRHLRHPGGGARPERPKGKLIGILTNRDVRFASNPGQPVSELMTKDRLITVREGVTQDEARRLLHQFRIEKLLVVDDHFRCIGLITVKDIEKQVAYPNAAKDEQGRLRVAAATTTGEQGFERSERLIDAGCDVIVVDTAHGHSVRVLESVTRVKKLSNSVQVIAGNVATRRGREGADRCRRGCRQGRHRAGLHLHHPHRRGRRRAPAHRHHGGRRGGPRSRRSGDRRRRHQVFGRPRQGARRRRRPAP